MLSLLRLNRFDATKCWQSATLPSPFLRPRPCAGEMTSMSLPGPLSVPPSPTSRASALPFSVCQCVRLCFWLSSWSQVDLLNAIQAQLLDRVIAEPEFHLIAEPEYHMVNPPTPGILVPACMIHACPRNKASMNAWSPKFLPALH